MRIRWRGFELPTRVEKDGTCPAGLAVAHVILWRVANHEQTAAGTATQRHAPCASNTGQTRGIGLRW